MEQRLVRIRPGRDSLLFLGSLGLEYAVGNERKNGQLDRHGRMVPE